MREAFQRLVDILPPTIGTDEEHPQKEEVGNDDFWETVNYLKDVLATQLLSNDALAIWERGKKQQAERTILLAAKIIAQAIAPRH